MLKKIVIIGPESTGKSTLCELLAQHYNTMWCPEFAREYLLTNGTDYSFDDLLSIAKGQLAMEEEYSAMVNGEWAMGNGQRAMDNNSELRTQNPELTTHHSPLLFIDTDMYVMKVWCEFVFDKCHNWILKQIAERKYDLYLLCNTDVPWVKDELREYPDLERRQQLFHIYKDLLVNQSTSWVEISGSYEERLEKAINAIQSTNGEKFL
ncbi:MAG: ATP-binding protein [Sphingobacteriales bacterium]|nr:ATP-binding protein [Sphingobacteriales bacterium]MBI3719463.1 ATP-binding protein [Sphingobacteriales bacterium]